MKIFANVVVLLIIVPGSVNSKGLLEQTTRLEARSTGLIPSEAMCQPDSLTSRQLFQAFFEALSPLVGFLSHPLGEYHDSYVEMSFDTVLVCVEQRDKALDLKYNTCIGFLLDPDGYVEYIEVVYDEHFFPAFESVDIILEALIDGLLGEYFGAGFDIGYELVTGEEFDASQLSMLLINYLWEEALAAN